MTMQPKKEIKPSDPKKPFASRYVRKETYSVEEVLKHVNVEGGSKPTFFDDDLMKMSSDRYKLFKLKGTVCVECGMVGTYFIKEQNLNEKDHSLFHFNLYGINAEGKEIMMTKDHIIARANGGPDHIDNYQPMCSICNGKKGSK